MTKWDDKVVRYSLLVAGETLDVKKIEKCLKDGIKVLWFGSREDERVLRTQFPKLMDAFFLSAYRNSYNVHLTIIDGNGIVENHSKLEQLEKDNPAFNLKQYEIEHDGDNPLVVVQAGAGSGKTFVMINRLLYLLHTKEDFHFSDVVMMTFTNEATDSMRRKLIDVLKDKLITTGNIRYLKWIEDVAQISISTIHSFLKSVIIEIGPLLGYGTDLKLTSMVMEKRKILRDIMDRQYGSDGGKVESSLGLPIHELENLALEFWKKLDNHGMSGYDVFSMDWGDTDEWRAKKVQKSLRNLFELVEEQYDARKMENNSLAMEDIIHEFNRVIDDVRIKEYIRKKYKYLFCDEFQDSDDVQIKTIAFLDKVYDGNLFVVGDVKQSIYRFRGATDSAFERLGDNIDYYFDTENRERTYTLTKNYRTSEDILQEIDGVFRIWGEKEYLRYKAEGPDSDALIPQIKAPGVYKQIELSGWWEIERRFTSLVNKLERKIKNQHKSIMVLTRYNWQLQRVKEWCESAGKACIIRESGTFYKSPAVREFRSFAEALLYNFEPMYIFNLLRTAYCYKYVDAEYLESLAGNKSEMFSYLRGLAEEEMELNKTSEDLKNRPVMSVLCELITTIKPSIKFGAIQKQKYIKKGYDAEEAVKQAVIDAKQYEADLQKLIQILADSFLDEFSSLSDICRFIKIHMETDNEEEPAEVNDIDEVNCIQGSTVHGAKGLEFDYVLIPFMNDTFGKNNRSEILIDKTTRQVGWIYKNKKYNQETHNNNYESLRRVEERDVIGDETRLLYVAMTRAKEGLYCFTCRTGNNGEALTWSDLLPEENDDANYL